MGPKGAASVHQARALTQPLNLPLLPQCFPNGLVGKAAAIPVFPPREFRDAIPSTSILRPEPGQRRESALPGKGLAPCRCQCPLIGPG